MRTLMIMRHAEAVAFQAGLTDYQRPLTELGSRMASQRSQAVALWPKVECLFASSAVRTTQTAAQLASALAWPVTLRLCPELYNAPVEAYLSCVQHIPAEVASALIIGHNPAISALVEALVPSCTISLPPAGLCVLQSATDAPWHALPSFQWQQQYLS